MSDEEELNKPKKRKAGPGRPPGLPNKMTATIKEAYEKAFHHLQRDSRTDLAQWAAKNQTDFYKIVTKLIPIAIEGKIDHRHFVVRAPQVSESVEDWQKANKQVTIDHVAKKQDE